MAVLYSGHDLAKKVEYTDFSRIRGYDPLHFYVKEFETYGIFLSSHRLENETCRYTWSHLKLQEG